MTALTRLTAMAEEALGLARQFDDYDGGERDPTPASLCRDAQTALERLAAAVQAMAPVVEAARDADANGPLCDAPHEGLRSALTTLNAKLKELTDG